jgi:putative Mn2+ efflux pump MntP
MTIIEILLLAISMAMDAFAVCLSAGALPQAKGFRPAFRLSFHFGLFQFLMPVLGWLVGTTLEVLIRNVDHWLALALLAFVGVRMIYSAFNPEQTQPSDPSRGWLLILLSIAVSIDALAIGLSLGLLGVSVWFPAILIGIVTSAMSLAGLRIGIGLGSSLGRPFQVAGGILLIGIGLRIALSHLATG